MASSNPFNNSVLPVSISPSGEEKEKERLIKGGDEKVFRGSAMSKRGAHAAISYMSCAGAPEIKMRLSMEYAMKFLLFYLLPILPLFVMIVCTMGCFFSSSVLLVMFNKAALSSYNFPSANVITLFQMISSTSFLYALRRWKIISFIAGESLPISDSNTTFVSFETLMHTLPLSVAYLLYMLVTMESVRGVNVPMYTTLRRTTVAFTMIMEYFLAGQRYTIPIVGSVGVILLGAFIAGARDLSFDFYGYAVVFLANITTAIYLATISRIGKSSGLNSFGLMWCNGIICGPVLLLWTFFRGELEMTINFPLLFSPGFLAVLLLSCTLAFFLNYSIFLNTTLNSALTQTICGNLKDFFTIGLGWMVFGGLPFDIFNVIGQFLGFLGSGLYAYYKLIGR